MPRLPAALLGLLCLTGCNDSGADGGGSGVAALRGREWRLEAFVTDGVARAVPAGVTVTLAFREDGQAGGGNGCNGYGGGYAAAADGSLSFGPLMQTEMACDEPRAGIETATMRLLADTARWQVADGTLTLGTADGRRSARFR